MIKIPKHTPLERLEARIMTEKQIEKKVCEYARLKGWSNYKFSSPSHRGVPDRIFLRNGARIVFVEFKVFGGKATILQTITLKELDDQGFTARIISSVDEGIVFFDELN